MSEIIDRFYTVQGLRSGSWTDLYSCIHTRSLSHALSELDGYRRFEDDFQDYRIVVDERRIFEIER